MSEAPRPPSGLHARIQVSLDSFLLDVELSVGRGETLALLGPNGAGKTTALESIAGLRTPDSGRIYLDGKPLLDLDLSVDLPPEKRHVGLVFQDFALFPHMTVFENVDYGPRSRGLRGEERSRVTRECISRLDLANLAQRRALELSLGQRQRVALARALASDARVLLLDEPFAALDATQRVSVRADLRTFLRNTELPALVVTHDPLDAFVLGDRLAILEHGRIVQSGRCHELLAHPRTRFVADLAGLNTYTAELEQGVGLKLARAGPVAFHVLADDLAGPVRLAFAPSDVALSANPRAGSFQNVFRVRVRERFDLPDRLRVALDAGVPIVADITREAARDLSLVEGEELWAMVKATSIRVYP